MVVVRADLTDCRGTSYPVADYEGFDVIRAIVFVGNVHLVVLVDGDDRVPSYVVRLI